MCVTVTYYFGVFVNQATTVDSLFVALAHQKNHASLVLHSRVFRWRPFSNLQRERANPKLLNPGTLNPVP